MFRNIVVVVDDGLASRLAATVFLPPTLFFSQKNVSFCLVGESLFAWIQRLVVE